MAILVSLSSLCSYWSWQRLLLYSVRPGRVHGCGWLVDRTAGGCQGIGIAVATGLLRERGAMGRGNGLGICSLQVGVGFCGGSERSVYFCNSR